MFTPIRLRLTLSFLAVLLIGMGLAAVLAWLSVEQLYLSTQRENLLAQARLTASTLQGAPLPSNPVEPYSQASNAMPGLHTRVLSWQGRVIAEQGGVIVGLPLAGDGPVQAPLAENSGYVPPADLIQRPEIQQALAGWPATAVRRVEAAGGRRVLYAAAPILGDNGTNGTVGIAGIVYLATPLPPAGLPPPIIAQLVGAVLVAALLAGMAGTLLARRIARPLERLARSADAVAAGDLSQSVAANSGVAELHSLGLAFNAMIAGLRQSDQAKNAFITDVTHELRTPLTVIKGTIETLEDGALDDISGRGPLLASMQREADRLIRLVNDLLVLTRADAGALQLRIQPLDAAELARSRCRHLAPLAARRRVALRVDADPAPPALADPDRLAQVLDNLLDNAIRHTAEGSAVTVSIQPQNGELRCAVSDHGPGIPSEHLPLIFDRFYRVDASRNRQTGGTGLGLSIVRALVLAQSGRIDARSTEGHGATITFHLPLAS